MAALSFQYMLDVDNPQDNVNQFARIIFDGRCQFTANSDWLSTGLELLSPENCCEQVLSSVPVIKANTDKLMIAHSDHFLWVACWADEKEFNNLTEATESIYSQLLGVIANTGYQHLIRVWNYFERINQQEDGLERYRQFCVGRFNAFCASGLSEESFPSACALGHSGGHLVVYAVASKVRPVHFENPNQQSAYFYPSEYGPRSPSFSRASVIKTDDSHALVFVSGTASVVGHKTAHPFDVNQQLKVTFNNLDVLTQQIQNQYQLAQPCSLTPSLLKIYIRNASDLNLIKQSVDAHFPGVDTVYLRSDICRADLMLEIDGIWNLSFV